MANLLTEHDKVVNYIKKTLESQFRVLTNLDGEINHIAGIFPDLILLDKEKGNPVFVIEVRRNGDIAGCITKWKTYSSSLQATLYIVVPHPALENSKAIAALHGLKAKFGYYEYSNDSVTSVSYE